MSFEGCRLLIVGNPESFHVGGHLLAAARGLELKADIVDVREASAGSRLWARFNWWMRGHRPPRLRSFGLAVLEMCHRFRPDWLLTTGLAALDQRVLAAIGKLGTRRLNYLSDDPWNPAHRAPWFQAALPQYDFVFSPRRANLEDLRCLGCKRVEYMPFAYAPECHFPQEPLNEAERDQLTSDVAFVGGADADRLPYVAALASAGVRMALYGGYWERYSVSRPFARGKTEPGLVRRAMAAAKVVLCLVRRANRDGHVMRTFESAASAACMLAEDTPEHRAILGADRETVVYFHDRSDMMLKVTELLADAPWRRRLGEAVHRRIVSGGHTYRDRLAAMLATAGKPHRERTH